MQLNMNTAFFRRKAIEAASLRVDEGIVPNFEDEHFVGRYLLVQRGSQHARDTRLRRKTLFPFSVFFRACPPLQGWLRRMGENLTAS